MTAPPAAEAPEQPRGWRRVFLALVAFAAMSTWPMLGFFAPITQWSLFLVAVIAACAVIGWARGGSWQPALAWLLGVALLLLMSSGGGDPYFWIERGWILLMAGTFGLTSVLAASHPFFVRALGSLTACLVLALLIVSGNRGSFERVQGTLASSYVSRGNREITRLEISQESIPANGFVAEGLESYKAILRISPRMSLLVAPALLALQSLAALALGWTIFHRLSRTRAGAGLSRLREFRFNDQLVWGLAVGITIVALPAFEEARLVGANLVLFFGALYFVRGLGVLAWATKGAAFVALAIMLSIFPFALLLGAVGLSDTWLDWRSRAKAA